MRDMTIAVHEIFFKYFSRSVYCNTRCIIILQALNGFQISKATLSMVQILSHMFLGTARSVGLAAMLLALLTAPADSEANGTEATAEAGAAPASPAPPLPPPPAPAPSCLLASQFLRSGAKPMTPGDFNASACALCYHFLPTPARAPAPALAPARRRWRLVTAPHGFGLRPPPNASVDEVRGGAEGALSPLELRKWRECCDAALLCCQERLLTFAAAPDARPPGACPSVWDGWRCWEETPAGATAVGDCPPYILATDNLPNCHGSSSRRCAADGRWANRSAYGECGVQLLAAQRRRSYELVAAYAVSIACLLPALALFFLLYRQLHGHRITLHRNLFGALLLHAAAETLFRVALVLPEVEAAPRPLHRSLASQNSEWCRALVVATKYFRSASFMWMFCEGFYLHRLLAAAFSPDGSLLIFYLIGWGTPVLPTILYAGMRLGAGDGHCWMHPSSFEWIVIVPNILSLLANAVFLVYILRVLMTLNKPSEQEPAHYRRGVRATLVLVPLFGVHLLLTLFRPPAACAWRRAHELLDHLLDGLQGAAVAAIFCFFNGEVHELIRRARRTLVDRYQPGLRPSRGSHSFSTAQATL